MKKQVYTLAFLTSLTAIVNAQNVGINTDGSNPDGDAILHINNHSASGVDSSIIRIENEQNGANDVTGLELYNSGTGANARWDVYIPASGSTDLRIKNNGTDRITIQNDGDLGIGTTAPVSGLDVQTSLGYATTTITSATTLDNTHNVVLCNTGPYTVTLPPAADNTGRVYYIKNIDADGDDITIDGNVSETIDGNTSYTLSAYQHVVRIISDGTNWHIVEEANEVLTGTISSITCGSATDNGSLVDGVVASGVSSVIPYTGGNGGTHSGQTVTSTGVTGLTATLSSGIFAYGNSALSYSITGTPASSGTANFAINIGGQTCTLTRTVAAGLITTIDCAGATDNGTLTDGEAASGVNSVLSYTGGNAGTHSGQTVTSTGVTGLTATLSSGTFASGSGTLTYTITGTPSGSGTASFAVNIGGQTCTLERTVAAAFSCGDNVTFTYNGGSVTYGTVLSSTGECWLDRNLGASQVATSSSDYLAYGDLFQWGRADDGHQEITWTNSTTGAAVNGTTTTQADVPGDALFIKGSNDWRTNPDDDLWNGESATNNPCPSGWRIPTDTELDNERTSWSSNNAAGAFGSVLKLPIAGVRLKGSGSIFSAGVYGYYWNSSISGTKVGVIYFASSDSYMNTDYRAHGASVRCIKD